MANSFCKEMNGKLTSLDDGPKRNVKVTITPELLDSEIAKPRGAVDPSRVHGLVLERRRFLFLNIIRIWLQTDAGDVDFYRSRSMFDIALVLDELEASIGDRPRTLKNIKEREKVSGCPKAGGPSIVI